MAQDNSPTPEFVGWMMQVPTRVLPLLLVKEMLSSTWLVSRRLGDTLAQINLTLKSATRSRLICRQKHRACLISFDGAACYS